MKINNSSNIAEINYNSKKSLLSVEFILKTKPQEYVYIFSNVPEEIWLSFKEAVKKKESIGKLFAKIVKGKFEFAKIKKTERGKKKRIGDVEK